MRFFTNRKNFRKNPKLSDCNKYKIWTAFKKISSWTPPWRPGGEGERQPHGSRLDGS